MGKHGKGKQKKARGRGMGVGLGVNGSRPAKDGSDRIRYVVFTIVDLSVAQCELNVGVGESVGVVRLQVECTQDVDADKTFDRR